MLVKIEQTSSLAVEEENNELIDDFSQPKTNSSKGFPKTNCSSCYNLPKKSWQKLAFQNLFMSLFYRASLVMNKFDPHTP